MLKTLLAGIILLIGGTSAMAQSLIVVEDGESGATGNWQVFDTTPDGYAINNNSEGQNSYISFTSNNQQNGFMLGNTSAAAPGLDLADITAASFRLRATRSFTVAFVVETDQGLRYLRYSHSSNTVPQGGSSVVSVGLGRSSYNGYWHPYSRNLQADLDAAQPGNTIIKVHGVQVRGSIDLDDVVLFNADQLTTAPLAIAGADVQVSLGDNVQLDGSQSSDADDQIALWRWTDDKHTVLGNTAALSLPADFVGRSDITLTVTDNSGASHSDIVRVSVVAPNDRVTIVEDAEQGDTANWRISDKTPAGYTLDNVSEDGNRFISLKGSDRLNSFITGNRTANAAALGIENQNSVSWRMRTDSPFTVYFGMDTTEGFRYVYYTHYALSSAAAAGSHVRAGLGTLAYDGEWHFFNKDLLAELQLVQPGNQIISINSMLIRGSTDIDDVTFYSTTDAPPVGADLPGTPELLAPDADAALSAESIDAFTWQSVEGAVSYEFELSTTAEGFDQPLFSATIAATSCTDSLCTQTVELPATSSGAYDWRVRTVSDDGESMWATRSLDLLLARPATPVNVSPAVGVDINEGATVEFVWQFDPIVEIYDYHVFDRTTSTQLDFVYGLLPADVCDGELCRFSAEVTLPIAANHAWRIRAGNASGRSDWSRSIFTMVEIVADPPAAPELELPLAQATLEGGTSHSFSWLKSEGASSYALQLVLASAPTDALYSQSVADSACGADSCSLSVVPDLPAANDYQWQVNASNAAGASDFTARIFSLNAPSTTRPATPVNVSPAVAADLVQNSEVEFVWQRDPDAFTYEFHLFDNVAKTTTPYVVGLLANQVCADDGLCRLTQTVTQPVSTYHAWRVRGRNSIGPSGWSRSIFSIVDSAVIPDPGNAAPVPAYIIAGFDEDAIGSAPFTVSVDPSASADDEGIVSYRWVFGDNSQPLENTDASVVEHTYTEPGDFTLELEVTDAQGLTANMQRQVTVSEAPILVDATDAARLLAQATFGATLADIEQVQSIGLNNWIDRQFTLQGDSHLAYVQQHSNGSGRSPRHEIWWKSAVDGEDQLRQRVAFALSQLFVVSDSGYTLANAQYGITGYYQMLLDNAFGNYRDLLEKVTLHPVMGIYLSMLQNGKGDPEASTRPDENYAREVLQLFTIGLHRLNQDGSTDGSPVFSQDQVEAFSRVFTGWNYADAGRWDRPLFTRADMINPMLPFEEYHDTDQKTLLNGEVLPAGLSAREDLERALDNIFNHPNVGPFVVKQLIMRLVTSNPSRQYVSDIAGVFNNDGTGTRGNLAAVIKAILVHNEARVIPDVAAYGKLREPVLRLSHLWRTFGVLPGLQSSAARDEYNTVSPQLMDLEVDTGQAPLKSPSVFNFFQPGFSPVGVVADRDLNAPEFELFTESNELATSNRIGRQIQQYSVASISDAGHPVSFLDFTYEVSLASDVETLLDHLNLVLLSDSMGPALRDLLTSHLQALADTPAGHLARVRDAITLIVASPDYLVQM